MIRVHLAPEPADFNEKVRQPGLRAIAELVGEPSDRPRRGRPRQKVADRREDIPAAALPPLWAHALADLLQGYSRLCAYLCLYIPRGTGAPSVDHMLPKSLAWDRVYAWDNYRLASAWMNARKGAARDVLDPFEVEDGWFELELCEFQVRPAPGLPPDTSTRVVLTIDRLGLADPECCRARREYVEEYLSGHVDLDYLRRHSPFVYRELKRQGHLRPEDR